VEPDDRHTAAYAERPVAHPRGCWRMDRQKYY
jgi:hypothetical protein